MLVEKDGIHICETCQYWTSFADGCNYLLREGHSRVYDSHGNREVEPGDCNKYVERVSKVNVWRKQQLNKYENTH
jgi:hypothetical protein